MQESEYYVRFKGKVTGPVSLAELQQAIRRGGLTRAHAISPDRHTWFPAGEHAALFPGGAPVPDPGAPETSVAGEEELPEFSDDPPPKPAAAEPPPSRENWLCAACGSEWDASFTTCPACEKRSARAAVRGEGDAFKRVRQVNFGLGLAVGILSLAMMQIPFWGPGEEVVFWWDLLAGGDPQVVALIFIALVAALTLCVVSPVLQGVARGAVFFGLGLLGMVTATALSGSPALLWVLPYAGLLAGAGWRNADGGGLGPRLALCIAGVIACTAAFALLILLLTGERGPWPTFDTWFEITAFVMAIQGVCAGLAAGILGVVSIRRNYIRSANLAIQVLSYTAVFSPAVGLALLIVGYNEYLGLVGAWLSVFVLRAVLAVACLLLLLIYGLIELALDLTRLAEAATAHSNGGRMNDG